MVRVALHCERGHRATRRRPGISPASTSPAACRPRCSSSKSWTASSCASVARRELWRLEKLGRVELSGNQIAQVPPEVTSARALRVLDLRGNPIGESSKKLQIALDDAKVQLSVDPHVKFA